MTKLLRLANFVYFVSVCYSSLKNRFSIFACHPIAMSLVYILATEAISGFSYLKKIHAINRHHLLMQIVASVLLFGFGMIYYNKEISSKYHFTSDHGFGGLIIASCILMQAAFGGVMREFKLGSTLTWKSHAFAGMILPFGILFISWLHVGQAEGWLRKEGNWVSYGSIVASGLLFAVQMKSR